MSSTKRPESKESIKMPSPSRGHQEGSTIDANMMKILMALTILLSGGGSVIANQASKPDLEVVKLQAINAATDKAMKHCNAQIERSEARMNDTMQRVEDAIKDMDVKLDRLTERQLEKPR